MGKNSLFFFFLICKFHRTAIFLDCTILVFIHLFFFLLSLFVRAKKIIFAMAEKYFSSLLQMAACVLPANSSWQTFREYNLYENPFFFEINLQIIQMPHCTRPLAIFIRFPPELLLHVYFLLSLVYPFLEQYPLSRFNIFKYRVSAPVNNRLRDIEPESNNDFHGCVDQI